MIAHIVLFRLRPDLPPADREALVAAFETALRSIPTIRRARVGARVRIGRAYEAMMRADYPYAAVLEFDDRAGLSDYLEHPSHERLAAQFFNAFEDALMYDFELSDGTAVLVSAH